MRIDTDGSVTAAYLFVVEHLSCAKRIGVAVEGLRNVTDKTIFVIEIPSKPTGIHTVCVYSGHEAYGNGHIDTETCVWAVGTGDG